MGDGLYSTGVVLCHRLTGTRPFRGSKMALLAAHLNKAPMPMKEANPKVEVPPEVQRVVMQRLEKDPANRPQSARACRAPSRSLASLPAGSGQGPTRRSPSPRFPLGVSRSLR